MALLEISYIPAVSADNNHKNASTIRTLSRHRKDPQTCRAESEGRLPPVVRERGNGIHIEEVFNRLPSLEADIRLCYLSGLAQWETGNVLTGANNHELFAVLDSRLANGSCGVVDERRSEVVEAI